MELAEEQTFRDLGWHLDEWELDDGINLLPTGPFVDPAIEAGQINWPVTQTNGADPELLPSLTPSELYKAHPESINGRDLHNVPGALNFKLQIAETSPNDIGAARRDSNFVFSPITNRLYCKPGELVPLQVVFNRQAPTDLVLNLFVVFDEQTHRTENVETCPHHRVQAEAAKLANPSFLVRAANDANIEYLKVSSACSNYLSGNNSSEERHGAQERHMLRVPVVPVGSGHFIVLLKFMCRNSCPGGMNRRATSLVGMLSSANNDVLGVSFVKVKVVTCPIRDARRDHDKVQQHNLAGMTPPVRNGLTLVNGNDKLWADPSSSSHLHRGKRPLPAKIRSAGGRAEVHKRDVSDAETGGASSDTEEIFTLHVRGRKNFQYLSAIAEGLELRRQAKKKKRKEAKPNSYNNNNNNNNNNSNNNSNNSSISEIGNSSFIDLGNQQYNTEQGDIKIKTDENANLWDSVQLQ